MHKTRDIYIVRLCKVSYKSRNLKPTKRHTTFEKNTTLLALCLCHEIGTKYDFNIELVRIA